MAVPQYKLPYQKILGKTGRTCVFAQHISSRQSLPRNGHNRSLQRHGQNIGEINGR